MNCFFRPIGLWKLIDNFECTTIRHYFIKNIDNVSQNHKR